MFAANSILTMNNAAGGSAGVATDSGKKTRYTSESSAAGKPNSLMILSRGILWGGEGVWGTEGDMQEFFMRGSSVDAIVIHGTR